MTKEQFEFLRRFQSNFETVRTGGYTRNINKKDRQGLLRIYNEFISDKKIVNINCNNCLVDILRELGKYYRDHIEPLDQFAAHLTMEQPEPEIPEEKEKKEKSGKPKKKKQEQTPTGDSQLINETENEEL